MVQSPSASATSRLARACSGSERWCQQGKKHADYLVTKGRSATMLRGTNKKPVRCDMLPISGARGTQSSMLQQGPGIQLQAKTGFGPARVLTRADVGIFWKKYARLIIGSMLIAVGGAVVYLIFASPSYVGRSELLIEPLKVQGGGEDRKSVV